MSIAPKESDHHVTDVGDSLALFVNAAGSLWKHAKQEYDAVPWWRLPRKLRLRTQLTRRDIVFAVSIDMYRSYLESR